MTQIARENGTVLTALLLVFLATLSCSTGYNKYADEYYAQGKIYYENMEYDRSIDSFTKVLELAPDGDENNRVYYMRGRSYLKNRQYDQAIYDFSKALDLTGKSDKPMRFLVYEVRGDGYFGKKAWPNAIQDYSMAISLLPEHENVKYVYLNRGWASLNNNDLESAIKDFSKATSIDPKLAEAYYGRGTAWLKKADPQRALPDAKEALRLKPDVVKYDDFVYEISSGTKTK
ncbi:MAG: tetratricopeptide repeat protein [Deltaproteobacteria bacterium]|nr:tetratricopeptide repeat protein [Deltaproteobacteria bacterium]